jgi:hypothetical protein
MMLVAPLISFDAIGRDDLNRCLALQAEREARAIA